MHAPTPLKSPLSAASASAQPPRMLREPLAWRLAPAVAALGAAALLGVWAIAPSVESTATLQQDVQAFQERVTAGTATPSGMPATEVLARRYLDTLPPDLRQGIAEQVRAEQREGLTPAGNDAFVMRRLALYEQALQEARLSARVQP
jgi:hypothetical protein